MTWASRCCFLVPLDLACSIIGICSFILSMFLVAAGLALVIIDHGQVQLGNIGDGRHYLHTLVELDMNRTAVEIVLTVVLLIGLLGMISSVLLLVGVRKNFPNLVLAYFCYSTIVTIICLISSLLELLDSGWILALITFGLSLTNIHFLIVVHSVYELMLNGKEFRFDRRRSEDVNPILEYTQ